MEILQIVLILIIGVALGFVVGFLFSRISSSPVINKLTLERDNAYSELSRQKAEVDRRTSEADRRVAEAEKNCNDRIESERRHFDDLRRESDKQWNDKFEAMKQQSRKEAAEMLASKQEDLQKNNRLQIDELLKPVKEQFASFQKAVEEARKQNDVNSATMKESFEGQMKLFAQQQTIAVNAMNEQTKRISDDATNLAKALKGDSKLQGNWGEMVLETMLEQAGLHKNEEFFVQEKCYDEEDRLRRPDVIVRLPEGRSLVIDSKVSLTAYANAVAETDETQRDLLLKKHVKSMRDHVDELAKKGYGKIVENAMDYVLMFVPNEGSYIAAMRHDPALHQYAFDNHVIIISSSNLLMTIQLAYNMWQNDKQKKNVSDIVSRAASLYDKVVLFQTDFEKIGVQINRLAEMFSDAKSKLSTGRGNALSQLEKLKSLGVTPQKQLTLEDADDDK
ncbi:MAG: DNA recombination protein RmuC [Bacteroidales bacterium]|nr:DNA recombination protein RmuC [Bacteroidales bacterium]